MYYCQIDSYPDRYYYEFTDEDATVTTDYTGLSVGFYTYTDDGVTREDVTDKCVITPAAGSVELKEDDQGDREATVEYTDANNNVYTMHFNIGFVYLNSSVAPPTGIYLAHLPDNVFYSVGEGDDYATVDHTGLKICATWDIPKGSSDEQTARLKQKLLDKYPDMFEATTNGQTYLVRDITSECIVDPGTGDRLWNQEGTGQYVINCVASWVDEIEFSQFKVNFDIYLTDNNTGKTTSKEAYNWTDPEKVDSWSKTVTEDPVTEIRTWRDPAVDRTYVNSESYEYTSTTMWASETIKSTELIKIRYTKSFAGIMGHVGSTWEYNKYFEVTGTYADQSEGVLVQDDDYLLSIKDGTTWKEPGTVYQTASATEDPNITCSVKIIVTDIGDILTGSLAECMQAFIDHGAYIYSYANTVEKANSEALHTIRCLKGHKLSLPVYFDAEDKSIHSFAAAAFDIWDKVVSSAGYETGLYSGYYFRKSYMRSVAPKTWWLAWYTANKPNTGGWTYDIWQYSSKGQIPGISGNVDVNNLYNESLLKSAGYKDSVSTAENKPAGSVLDNAYKVMKDGINGDERKEYLGSMYTEVQNLINHIYSADIGTLVSETLAGKYGNGDVRKTVLGTRYEAVQNAIDKPKLIVDGVLGAQTIKALQTFLKVDSDGIMGQKTVRALQSWAGCTVDGILGTNTKKAVQKMIGVTADGIWGVNTIKALQTFLNGQ